MELNQNSNQNWLKEDIISYIKSTESIEEVHSVLWNITENVENVSELISALQELMCSKNEEEMNQEINLKKTKIVNADGSLDFIFDHYLPLIEATSIDLKNEKHISSRINIIHLLCEIMIDFPTNINPYFKYNKSMWNILLKIMKRCNHGIHYSSNNNNITQCHPLVFEAFRSAIYLFEKSKKRMGQKTQANRLLSLIINNQNDYFLNELTIRYVMKIHPPEFGFVTVCKQIIGKGISNPHDLGLIHDILKLPYVRYPTDVYKYLFSLAVTHKTLSNLAMHVVENTFYSFSHLVDFKTWCTLFIKRCFEFISFAFHKKGKQITKEDQPKTKYCRRIYLIRRFNDMLFKLNIDWLSSVIQKSAYTVTNLDEDSNAFLYNHYDLQLYESEGNETHKIELDEKIKEDISSTNVEQIDFKKMLIDVRTSLPIITLTIKCNTQNSPYAGRRLTFAEVRSQYLKNKSKLPKRKYFKQNSHQISDDIEILMAFEGMSSSSQNIDISNIEENEEKMNDAQSQLASSGNENCITEVD
ncbi:hypothetical protein M9Y10_034551 [Tritrichomonas musculus]|uniref:Uncharacterized protein n=1 Tax=Tritrichomonas musculus TaxID=1915356 RepID=A0ABR2KG05_9EUKA